MQTPNKKEFVSKVATVSALLRKKYPDEQFSKDEIRQDLERVVPLETDLNKMMLDLSIAQDFDGNMLVDVPMTLSYNFPESFTEKRISNKVKQILKTTSLEFTNIESIKTVQGVKNGYESNFANQYTFTRVADVYGENLITDIHLTALTYDQACKTMREVLEDEQRALDVSSTTYSIKPTTEQIEKYKNWTLTAFSSPRHQEEIVILPDSGMIIDELGFLRDPSELGMDKGVPITRVREGETLSELDNDKRIQRLREMVRGIVSIHLDRNKDEDRRMREEFEEILKIPKGEGGYDKKDYYMWVYNNELPDTDKLSSYLEWCEVDYDSKVGKKVIAKPSKPKSNQNTR